MRTTRTSRSRPAMTGGDARAGRRPTSRSSGTSPGCSARRRRRPRLRGRAASTIDLGDDLAPGRADRRPRPPRPDEPRRPRRRRPHDDASRRVQPLPARHRRSRSTSRSTRRPCRRSTSHDRPGRSPDDDEPDVAPPDRPPRARPRARRSARRSARRADRAAVPARTARACASSAALPLDEGAHDHPDDDIDPRLEALRGVHGRTTPDDGGRSRGRLRRRSRRPRATSADARRASHARRPIRRSIEGAHDRMGVPKRRVSHARQGERRAHLALERAEARGVSALPRAEAAAPRLPELRLLPRPPGDRAQARPATDAAALTRSTAIDRPSPRPPAADDGRGVPRRRRRDGRRPRPGRGRPRRPRSRPRAPRRPGASSSATRRPSAASPATLPAERLDRPRLQVVGMDEHPALRAAREEGRLDPRRDATSSSSGEADAVVTAGHTGAGMAAAVLRLGRLPGVDRPALAVQMITDAGPARAARHRRQPRLDRPRTSPSTPGWARSSPSASSASPTPRVALLSIGEEKGKGDARIQRATELLDATDLRLRRQRRGQGPRPRTWPTSSSATRSLGNVVIKFFEGLSTLHLRPVAGRVPAARSRGRLGVPAHAAGDRPDPRASSTTSGSAARRCSASRAR